MTTVDVIKNTAGAVLLNNGYPRQPGRIIEYLSSPCDGSTVTVGSGAYTFPAVTAQQGGTVAYQEVTGSDIMYLPPAGTTEVKYRFTFSAYWVAAHAINDYKFFIDGVEVLAARHNRSGQYIENRYCFEWSIPIGEGPVGAPTGTGRQLTWTVPKRLSMQFRIYGASNYSNHHGTTYWDGAGGNQFNMPILSIIAIA